TPAPFTRSLPHALPTCSTGSPAWSPSPCPPPSMPPSRSGIYGRRGRDSCYVPLPLEGGRAVDFLDEPTGPSDNPEPPPSSPPHRLEEHTSELQSRENLV